MVLTDIYAPTKNYQGDQILILAELREQLLNFLDKIILGGDVNTCMDPSIDNKQGCIQESRSNYDRKYVIFQTSTSQYPVVHLAK